MKSTDGGRGWRSVDPPDVRISPSDTPITDMPVEVAVSPRYAEDGRVLAVYRMGIAFAYQAPPERRVLFESTDRGETWTRIGDDQDGTPTYDVQVHPDGAVTGSTRERVLISRTHGGPWEAIAEFGQAYRVAVAPNHQDGQPVVVGNGVGETMQISTGGRPVFSGFRLATRMRACLSASRPAGYGYGPDCLTGFSVAARSDGSASIFAVPGDEASNARSAIMRSDDGGKTWTRLEVPTFERIVALALSPGYPEDRTIFAAARSRVFRSTDDGATWHAKKPACVWDPLFPTSVDWAPVDDMEDLERLVEGQTVVKVRGIDHERVDRDGSRVVNTVNVLRVFAGEVPAGPIQIRDGFDSGSPSFSGHGRCLVAGEEYYLILKASKDGSGPAAFDMRGHPLTQFAVRGGRVTAPGSIFWLGDPDLNGMSEAEFVEMLERAVADP